MRRTREEKKKKKNRGVDGGKEEKSATIPLPFLSSFSFFPLSFSFPLLFIPRPFSHREAT